MKTIILILVLILLTGCPKYYIVESIPTEGSYVECPNEEKIPLSYSEIVNLDNETKQRFIEKKCIFHYSLEIKQTAELR